MVKWNNIRWNALHISLKKISWSKKVRNKKSLTLKQFTRIYISFIESWPINAQDLPILKCVYPPRCYLQQFAVNSIVD